MFVTTLGMDNFDCTKVNAHLKKFTACLREWLIHKWKQGGTKNGVARILEASITSPTSPPYVAVPHTTTLQLSCLLQRSTNDILRILVKAQPSTRSTGPRSPIRLGIQSQDLGLPNEYSLGHCGLSAASRHKLAFTSRHYALLTATDTTALY